MSLGHYLIALLVVLIWIALLIISWIEFTVTERRLDEIDAELKRRWPDRPIPPRW